MMLAGGNEAVLVDEQLRIARSGAVYLIGYLIVSTASYSITDIYYYDENGLYFVSSLAIWGLGYALLVMLLRVSAPVQEIEYGGIGGYFGLSLLTSIAISIGLLLLLLPGIYLCLRWLPAFARYQASSDTVTEAMSWSWQHTTKLQRAMALNMIGPVLLYGVLLGVVILQESQFNQLSETAFNVSSIVLNTTISVAIAWLQLLGVAAYRVIQRQQSDPIETFS